LPVDFRQKSWEFPAGEFRRDSNSIFPAHPAALALAVFQNPSSFSDPSGGRSQLLEARKTPDRNPASTSAFEDNQTTKGKMKLNHSTLAALAVAGLSGLASRASADVITDWNLITVNATKTAGQNSNLGTRTDAIEAIAVYDAVNSIRQFGTKYHYYAPNSGSAQAAAAQAAHDVLVNYFPSQQAALDAALTNSLANITDGPIGNGRTVGSAAADDIVARPKDG